MTKRVFCLLSVLLTGVLLLNSIGCLEKPKREEISSEKIETSDLEWKIYKDEELGFKLKYPADCEIDEWRSYNNMSFSIVFKSLPGEEYSMFAVRRGINLNTLTLEQLKKEYVEQFSQYAKEIACNLKVIEEETIAIDNEKAEKVTWILECGSITYEAKGFSIYCIKDKGLYFFYL